MAKKDSAKSSSTASTSGPARGDSRFANFESNPRFKLPSKSRSKVTVDKRFARLLQDDDFTQTSKVDKYGRKIKSDSKKKALQNLYQQEEDDDNQLEDPEVDDDDIVQRELDKAEERYDPARGGGFSSSESDSDSDDSDDDEVDVDDNVAVDGQDTAGNTQKLRDSQKDVEVGEVTNRIAIVNLDWDHIKSTDLMALFSSFAPKGGRIERVSIYPSEFGKERMQREEFEGPPKEIFKKGGKDDSEDESPSEDDSDSDSDEDEDEKIKKDLLQEGDDRDFDSDALRAYQLDRLRYYYAVMVCSDKATADKIYQATDGTEYQSSSNFIDLRFVPDDVTFDDEPRDECNQLAAGYKPTEFTTDALQHSKVKLTWDMNPEEVTRREEINRAFTGSRSDIQENDLRAYLASDSEGDGESDEELVPEEKEEAAEDQPKLSKKELKARKMREALGLSAEPTSKASKSGPVGDMQITFTPALMDTGKEKAAKQPEAEETTMERYKRKERERKARKKEKALAKRNGGADQGDEDDGNNDEVAGDDGDELGFNDPFFTADDPDAAAADSKPSKSAERKADRLKRREEREAEAAQKAAQKSKLQHLMKDDNDRSGATKDNLDHFDMNEILRAEKQKAKKLKGKGKKSRKAEEEDDEGHGGRQDDFKMDVADDRFKAVFDDHKFAIDPSHPQFKSTGAMRELLEEGRKKRKAHPADGEDDDGFKAGKKSKKQKNKGGDDGDDLGRLVASMKKKSQKKSSSS